MVKDFNKLWNEISEEEREDNRLYFNPDLAEYFEEIAQRLIGDNPKLKAVYESHPILWAVSEEKDVINAAFVHQNTPFFCLGRGLIDYVENVDQLAYVMGHELEHYYRHMTKQEKGEKHKNSHLEEGMADFNSMQRIAEAKYNIEEGLKLVARLRALEAQYEEKGETDKVDQISKLLELLDPHPEKKVRQAANEAGAHIASEKLASGEYGGVEVNADKIPITLKPEELNETDYISYIDRRFQEAKFDEMSTDEKNKFLVDMCFDVSISPFSIREKDFKQRVDQYLKSIEKDMRSQSREEREKSFEKGTAPAMTMIEEFLKVELNMYDNNFPDSDAIRLYQHTLLKAIYLWPTNVSFKGKDAFWKGLQARLGECIERIKKKEESYNDVRFLVHVTDLFRVLEPQPAVFVRKWENLPVLDNLKEGDLLPNEDSMRNAGDFIGLSKYFIHPELYHVFDLVVKNADGSIVASRVEEHDDKPNTSSQKIEIFWPNEESFLKYQEKLLKEMLHRKVLEQLKKEKEDLEDLLRTPDKKISDLLHTVIYFRDNFWPDLIGLHASLKSRGIDQKNPLYYRTVVRALNMEDISDVVPGWKYETFYWKELQKEDGDFKSGVKFDEEMLKKMDPQLTLFGKEYSPDLGDRITDKYIEGMLKDLEKYYYDYVFPSEEILGYNTEDFFNSDYKVHIGVHMASPYVAEYDRKIYYNFFPYQLEKIIKAYVDNAPKDSQYLLEQTAGITDIYNNLFRFYYAAHYDDLGKDFTDFKSPVPEYIRECLELPPFSYENADAYKKFIEENEEDFPAVVSYVVWDAMLHDQDNRFPLSLVKDLLMKKTVQKWMQEKNLSETVVKTGLLHTGIDDTFVLGDSSIREVFSLRILKICQDEKNWPKDLSEYTDTAYWLMKACLDKGAFQSRKQLEQGLTDYEKAYQVIKNGFLERIAKEKDPKKIGQAWLKIGKYLASAPDNLEDYDKTVAPALRNSPIWKQPLKDKVDTLIKIPDYLWGTDNTYRYKLASELLDEIEKIKNPKEREELLFNFLVKKGRLPNPELSDRVQRMWVKSVASIMGKIDDESEEYLKKIKPYIDKIKKSDEKIKEAGEFVAEVDKYTILKYLAEEVVSQKRLSREIRPNIISLENISDYDVDKWSLAIIGTGGIGTYLQQNPEKRNDLIDFLRSKGTLEDCKKIRDVLYPDFDKLPPNEWNNLLKSELSLSRIQQQYQAFWASDPNVQMFIMDSILRNTAKDDTIPSWEQNFDYVAKQIFPGDSQQSIAFRTALHAYIESRPTRDRNFGLARLLVASGLKSDTENEEEANQKIGKGIKIFLESIGPAGIKLGQALYAVPDIPDYIRDNLKDFTSNAARPARWEIYDWLENYKKMNPDEKEQIDLLKLGEILGSASFFVTADSGNGEVVKILRSGAKVRSEQEMGYIYDTLEKLSKSDAKILGDLAQTLLRIVKQAEESIAIETNMDIGEDQYRLAKKLYPETVTVNGITFDVKQAAWKQHGTKYAQLEKMEGVEIDKIKDPEYKKAASIAYFSMELLNIFSGKQFDFDRHIGQMKIDEKTNTLGLFDTGSMLLEEPTVEDQKALGTILYRTLENALDESHPKDFASALTEEIDRFYKKSKQPTAYITQVQRGLLALSGYYKDFSAKDFAQCVDIAFNNPDVLVSGHIASSFISEMLEKTGLFKQKTMEKAAPEEVAVEKEALGRLMFNVYAASQASDSDISMGEILEKERQIQKKAKIPVLGRLFSKKELKDDFDGIKIPRFFGIHLVKALRDKQIDPIIAKGMMKEAFDSICLTDKNNRDTPQVKRELGKQLYDLFIAAKKKGKSEDEIKESAKLKLKELSEKSVLARNLYAVLSLSEYASSDQKIDLKEVIWDIMSEKDLDKDVLRGVQSSMRENGQTFASLALRLRRPLSQIRKIRNVFSLFKGGKQKGYLKSLLERAKTDVMMLPEKVAIGKTAKGRVLRIASAKGVELADKNRSISYGGKRSTYGRK